jgi:uncharacterized protein (DUF433 family)
MTGDRIYLNAGIYTVPEAARLTRVSPGRIRRWLRGYRYRARTKKQYSSPPLLKSQFEPIDNKLALGFLDLMEVRFVDAFLKSGVSWDMIHKALDRAKEWFPGESHPFCTKRFVTDGRQIFVALHEETNESSLIDIVNSQQVFAEIMQPFIKELEFGEEHRLERWWPLGKDHNITVDPKRNFGQPTVFREGIPTRTLARSVIANGSAEEVARWYEISRDAVEEAVQFEQKLAA